VSTGGPLEREISAMPDRAMDKGSRSAPALSE